MSSGWIVLAVIVVLVIFAFGAYNRLVALSQRVNQAFADIDVQLKQRHDLIPNLVETVKGYAAHERGTLDEVVKARNAAISGQSPGQGAAAENRRRTRRVVADLARRRRRRELFVQHRPPAGEQDIIARRHRLSVPFDRHVCRPAPRRCPQH